MKTHCPVWAPPLLAVQFLTRVPVPWLAGLSAEVVSVGLGRAVGWFPLVGALVGALTAATLLLTEQLWPRVVAVILALIVEARLTGAFHEDAVADFCDGVGGGRDAEHARQIMKDSRIGSYGALGLSLAVALRAALMMFLPASIAVPAIIAAATFGRLLAAIAMVMVPSATGRENLAVIPLHGESLAVVSSPAGNDGLAGAPPSPHGEDIAAIPIPPRVGSLAKDIGARLTGRDAALAIATAIPGMLLFGVRAPLALLIACLGSVVFLIWFKALVLRRVGGSTGDCLGFAAYSGQLILLLAAVAS